MTAIKGMMVAVPQTTVQVPQSIDSVTTLVIVWIVATLLGIVPGSKAVLVQVGFKTPSAVMVSD
jgi:hypothetical protein